MSTSAGPMKSRTSHCSLTAGESPYVTVVDGGKKVCCLYGSDSLEGMPLATDQPRTYTRAHPNVRTVRTIGPSSRRRSAFGRQSASKKRAPLARTNRRAASGASDPENSVRTVTSR